MIKNSIIITLLCILTSACSNTGIDTIVNKEDTTLSVTVKLYEDEQELYKNLWNKKKGVLGQTQLDINKNTCTIKAVRPRGTNDTKTLVIGHELMHCLYGDYHK